MSIFGCIADTSTIDVASANPTASYAMQPHGGGNVVCTTIFNGLAPIMHLNPNVPGTPVPGVPLLPPPSLPNPTVLARPSVVGVVNSVERGVYFEGKLVPVIGDGLKAPGATPDPRTLTTPTLYPTIFIGTRT